jgi:hypothetical protein
MYAIFSKHYDISHLFSADGPHYPSDVLMYPWNVYNLYPAVSTVKQEDERYKNFKVLTLAAGYPTLEICKSFAAELFLFTDAPIKMLLSTHTTSTRSIPLSLPKLFICPRPVSCRLVWKQPTHT